MLVLTPTAGQFIQIGEARIWIERHGRRVRIDAPIHVKILRQAIVGKTTPPKPSQEKTP